MLFEIRNQKIPNCFLNSLLHLLQNHAFWYFILFTFVLRINLVGGKNLMEPIPLVMNDNSPPTNTRISGYGDGNSQILNDNKEDLQPHNHVTEDDRKVQQSQQRINVSKMLKNTIGNEKIMGEQSTTSTINSYNEPAYIVQSQQHPTVDSKIGIKLTSFSSSDSTTNISFGNLTALSNYKGYLDPEFVASINPFWLQFPPQPPKAHYALGIVYAFLMVLGMSGNILVIYLFIRCKTLRTPAITLVINLAVSDLLMVSEIPFFIYNSFNFGPAFGAVGCHLYGFVGGLSGTLSITTLTAISLDRYNVVVYPLDPLRSTTKWRSRIMVIICWIYSLFWSGIPLFPEWGLSKYSPEGFLTACSFDYLSDSERERWFMFLYFVFAWVIPLLLITYCYVHILRVVVGANSIQSSKDKNKTEIKLAAVVMGVIGLWFAAWTPYAIVALLGIFGHVDKLSPAGSMIPAVFAKVAACVDPYVYAVTHPRFRVEFGKMFLGHPDARASQFQTSVSRGTGRRRGTVQEDLPMDDRPRIKRGPLERGASSLCEESEVSMSIDLSDGPPDINQS